VVTAAAPAFTDAVSVTTLPEATVVTVPPPEVTARVVVVAGLACAEAEVHTPHTITARTANHATKLPRFRGRLIQRGEITAGIVGRADWKTGSMAELLLGTGKLSSLFIY
jgi:hypothetical protein